MITLASRIPDRLGIFDSRAGEVSPGAALEEGSHSRGGQFGVKDKAALLDLPVLTLTELLGVAAL